MTFKSLLIPSLLHNPRLHGATLAFCIMRSCGSTDTASMYTHVAHITCIITMRILAAIPTHEASQREYYPKDVGMVGARMGDER